MPFGITWRYLLWHGSIITGVSPPDLTSVMTGPSYVNEVDEAGPGKNREGVMSQRSIEIVVGKLIVDRGFRRTFLQWPHRSLIQLSTTGVVLSDLEVSALVATDRILWSRLAECVDPRLQVDEAAEANESPDKLAADFR
jgi:hypothetical protein